MERKRRIPKQVTTMEQNNEYLHKMFGMMREIQSAMVMQQNDTFNSTEIRLMNEVIYAQAKGNRLISTKLADRLGITRSAVSQIVAKLEERGAVRRVPDAEDGRAIRVLLTERGRAFDKAHLSRISNNDQTAMRGISPEEEAVLVELLTRIRNNLEAQ